MEKRIAEDQREFAWVILLDAEKGARERDGIEGGGWERGYGRG